MKTAWQIILTMLKTDGALPDQNPMQQAQGTRLHLALVFVWMIGKRSMPSQRFPANISGMPATTSH